MSAGDPLQSYYEDVERIQMLQEENQRNEQRHSNLRVGVRTEMQRPSLRERGRDFSPGSTNSLRSDQRGNSFTEASTRAFNRIARGPIDTSPVSTPSPPPMAPRRQVEVPMEDADAIDEYYLTQLTGDVVRPCIARAKRQDSDLNVWDPLPVDDDDEEAENGKDEESKKEKGAECSRPTALSKRNSRSRVSFQLQQQTDAAKIRVVVSDKASAEQNSPRKPSETVLKRPSSHPEASVVDSGGEPTTPPDNRHPEDVATLLNQESLRPRVQTIVAPYTIPKLGLKNVLNTYQPSSSRALRKQRSARRSARGDERRSAHVRPTARSDQIIHSEHQSASARALATTPELLAMDSKQQTQAIRDHFRDAVSHQSKRAVTPGFRLPPIENAEVSEEQMEKLAHLSSEQRHSSSVQFYKVAPPPPGSRKPAQASKGRSIKRPTPHIPASKGERSSGGGGKDLIHRKVLRSFTTTALRANKPQEAPVTEEPKPVSARSHTDHSSHTRSGNVLSNLMSYVEDGSPRSERLPTSSSEHRTRSSQVPAADSHAKYSLLGMTMRAYRYGGMLPVVSSYQLSNPVTSARGSAGNVQGSQWASAALRWIAEYQDSARGTYILESEWEQELLSHVQNEYEKKRGGKSSRKRSGHSSMDRRRA